MKQFKISHGSIARGPKQQRAYRKHRKTNPSKSGCDFCEFTKESYQVIAEYPLFWHVKNIFPYSIWDENRVTEQTMVVPKRHVISLSDFTPAEAKEYFGLISKLEAEGNAIYSRSNIQATKSVPHQHTHAIKTDGKQIKSLYFKSAPHVLIYR